ncbi:putative transmembrane protein [Rhizoctonia solani 123E]|uniref:Putative transmembrane protein n=1 Tax=Rhizoctonia solani 123E TaxID=1423351 RepID=A0A074RRU4_9AGAM|nr:putative transmembrane protein [Rhizoctonia solani 123E]
MGVSLPSEPSGLMLNLSTLVYLLGVTIVTWCITRSCERYPIYSRKCWVTMPWSRIWLLSTLVVSWLYLVLTGMLLFGAPPKHNLDRCNLATLACVLVYGTSKGFIYLCLIERVHAVWGNGRRRIHSPVYLTCMASLLPLGGIVGIMLAQGVRFLHNGYCIIGMSRLSSILIMSYDTFTNFLLTFIFVARLVRSTIRSTRLRTIAVRAAVASFVGLLIEIINGFILFALDGKEMIWVCLGACAADIVANAMLLYWAMNGPSSSDSSKNRTHSVHFSTIQRTNPLRGEAGDSTRSTTEEGVAQNNSVFLTVLRGQASPTNRQDDVFSEDMSIMSSEYVPTLEKLKPILRSSSQALCVDQQPWGIGIYRCSTCGIVESKGPANSVMGQAPGKGSSVCEATDTSVGASRVRRWST